MLYVPLILSMSLVAFGYTQDIDIQRANATSSLTASPDSTVTGYSTTSGSSTSQQVETSTGLSASSLSLSSSSPPPSSTTNVSVERLAASRALAWLHTQRDPATSGYRNNETARVVIAQQVALALGLLTVDGAEVQLTGKQLEVEIVVLLWRHHEIPITPPKLAVYALALSALCRDPRQFHGHDLIGTLLHHEPVLDLDFAHATLAACVARAHIRKKQIRRLLDIASAVRDHNIDTVSVTIVALKCIVRDHRHRNWLHSIRRPAVGLARQQLVDGSFGNVYNTAMAVQALHDIGDLSAHWNRTTAIRYLEMKQDPDGAFTDPGLTAETALALMNRDVNAIRLGCMASGGGSSVSGGAVGGGRLDNNEADNHVELDLMGHSMLPTLHALNDSDPRNITITYTLWVGTNVSENSTITLTALRNTSFYHIMQMASDLDEHYAFEASQWPNGHYVHTIAGYKEEPMGYHYWLLYRLNEQPDPTAPPANQMVAPVGVDDLLIDDGDHFLFWYKKL